MGKDVQIRYKPKNLNMVKDKIRMVTGHKKADGSSHQVETFYNAPTGALRLVVKGKEGLITKMCGVKGVLDVTQTFFNGKTLTVTCDKVAGLGDFVVLIAHLAEGQTDEQGEEMIKEYSQKLDLAEAPVVGGCYKDLVLNKK